MTTGAIIRRLPSIGGAGTIAQKKVADGRTFAVSGLLCATSGHSLPPQQVTDAVRLPFAHDQLLAVVECQ
jgi:hypothetical protein